MAALAPRPPGAPFFCMSCSSHLVHVAIHTPVHSGVGELLTYTSPKPLAPGTLVRVPLAQRELLGVVWDAPAQPAALPEGVQLRAVTEVLQGIAPLSAPWRRLVGFAAHYYQRSLGEIAVSALPPQLRDMTPEQLARRLAPPKPPKVPKPRKKAPRRPPPRSQRAPKHSLLRLRILSQTSRLNLIHLHCLLSIP